MDVGDDPYAILGVASDATQAELKQSYRKCALKHHPDRQVSEDLREESTKLFAKLSAAYELLSNPKHRRGYDKEQEYELSEKGSGKIGFDPSHNYAVQRVTKKKTNKNLSKTKGKDSTSSPPPVFKETKTKSKSVKTAKSSPQGSPEISKPIKNTNLPSKSKSLPTKQRAQVPESPRKFVQNPMVMESPRRKTLQQKKLEHEKLIQHMCDPTLSPKKLRQQQVSPVPPCQKNIRNSLSPLPLVSPSRKTLQQRQMEHRQKKSVSHQPSLPPISPKRHSKLKRPQMPDSLPFDDTPPSSFDEENVEIADEASKETKTRTISGSIIKRKSALHRRSHTQPELSPRKSNADCLPCDDPSSLDEENVEIADEASKEANTHKISGSIIKRKSALHRRSHTQPELSPRKSDADSLPCNDPSSLDEENVEIVDKASKETNTHKISGSNIKRKSALHRRSHTQPELSPRKSDADCLPCDDPSSLDEENVETADEASKETNTHKISGSNNKRKSALNRRSQTQPELSLRRSDAEFSANPQESLSSHDPDDDSSTSSYFSLASSDEITSSEHHSTAAGGTQFQDPFEIFKKVYREEFDEADPMTSSNDTEAAANAMAASIANSSNAQSIKMDSKKVELSDGRMAVVTTTVVTRYNGTEETTVKTSCGLEHTTTITTKDASGKILEEVTTVEHGDGTSTTTTMKKAKPRQSRISKHLKRHSTVTFDEDDGEDVSKNEESSIHTRQSTASREK